MGSAEDNERRALRWHSACTFSASLELAKQGTVGPRRAFAPIQVAPLQVADA